MLLQGTSVHGKMAIPTLNENRVSFPQRDVNLLGNIINSQRRSKKPLLSGRVAFVLVAVFVVDIVIAQSASCQRCWFVSHVTLVCSVRVLRKRFVVSDTPMQIFERWNK